jgi:hypothetical protein
MKVGPVSEPTAPTIVGDMILRQGVTGNYEIYDIGNNQILGAYALGQVATEWVFVGLGDFNGADTTDMILRDSITGEFEVLRRHQQQLFRSRPAGPSRVGVAGRGLRVAEPRRQ